MNAGRIDPTRNRSKNGGSIPSGDNAATVGASVQGWRGSQHVARRDQLAVEEPLEIRLAGYSVTVTMRTPGDDFDLAIGFLYSEGIIHGLADVASIAYCETDDEESATNIINLNPSDPAIVDPGRWQRNFVATSSCGVCGKASIESVMLSAPPLQSTVQVSAAMLYRLARTLRQQQTLFERTGGLHAAALFDLDGSLLALREDIGRHNAVDKVIGAMLRQQAPPPLSDRILLVSSRASFEIVQKALVAGIPVVAAVSAASSLAVELATSANMTLIGFLRPDGDVPGRFNVYAGTQTILT